MTQTTTKPLRKRREYVPTGEVGRHLVAAQQLIDQIQALEEELEPHRKWLLAHLNARDLSMCSLGHIQAHRKWRHKWTYSPECEREALALRNRQKWEQAEGIAKDNPTIYLSITSK